jgi:Leucine-rich repeat (LRR) protein
MKMKYVERVSISIFIYLNFQFMLYRASEICDIPHCTCSQVTELNYVTCVFDSNVESKYVLLSSDKRLQEIQKSSSEIYTIDTLTITLNSSNKIEISNTIFENLKIDLLIMIDNKLKKIDSNLFKGVHSIKSMYLSNNQLETIDLNTFANEGLFNSLESLILKSNSLKMIPSLYLFTTLIYLDLSYNKLSDDFNIDLKYLEALDLSHNRLNRFETSSFSFELKQSLEKLSLDANDFEIVPVFELENLIELSLSSNRLKSIDMNAFKYLEQLSQLDLSKNQINFIHESAFDSLINLIKLDLSYNFITELNPNWFTNMKNLEKLLLQNNQLKQFDFSSLNRLSFLNLIDFSNNSLTHIINCDLSKRFLNLKILRLSHNNLSDLNLDIGIQIPSLKLLYLSGNFLSKVPSDISTLIKLDISNQNGKLKVLPNYVFKRSWNQKRLFKLNIAGNENLFIENKAFCLNDSFVLNYSFMDIWLSKSTLNSVNKCVLKQLSYKFRRTRIFVVSDLKNSQQQQDSEEVAINDQPLSKEENQTNDELIFDQACQCDFRLYLARYNILIRDYCPKYRSYCYNNQDFRDECFNKAEFAC